MRRQLLWKGLLTAIATMVLIGSGASPAADKVPVKQAVYSLSNGPVSLTPAVYTGDEASVELVRNGRRWYRGYRGGYRPYRAYSYYRPYTYRPYRAYYPRSYYYYYPSPRFGYYYYW
jgi:hypothetical protein